MSKARLNYSEVINSEINTLSLTADRQMLSAQIQTC